MPVPVTAKLSREFYEKFGDKIADELVNWFNQVDATYRSDLRELNELNFARFDAKLEQRFAESDARWKQRMAESDVRWEQRMARMDQRFAEFEVRWERRMADLKTSLILWMFGFWTGSSLITLGTTLAILKLQ
jgi:hypothetical protein